MNDTRTSPNISIRKVPLLPFKLSVHCDCGGEFVFNDTPVAVHPRSYKHICNKCGVEVMLRESFPKTVYEEITGEPESN